MATLICSGVPSADGSTCRAVRTAARSSNDPREPSRMSTKFSFDSGMPGLFRARKSMYMMTSRSGSL
jgi:hypothetical protein